MTLSQNSIFRLPASDWNPTLKVLNEHGVTLDHLDMLRQNNGDNEYARRVGRVFREDGFERSTDTRIARILLGTSFIDVCDWVTLHGIRFTAKDKKAALKFPWDEDVLMSPDPWEPKKMVKDTHTAFWGVEKIDGTPLTVAKWIELYPETGQPRFYFSNNPWHAGQPYTDGATLSPRWYLLRTEIVPGSTNKSPDEQVAMLPGEYELPETVAEVTKDLLVYRKTGVRPNPSRWARCAETTVKTDKGSDGCLSCVGLFGEVGLRLGSWDGDRYDNVGAGASRKI